MAVEHNLRHSAAVPATVEVLNPQGASDVVLICEHASRSIPKKFDNLGLDEQALQSHIAWDPGALEVAADLSRMLDATLVYQTVSRLLYDCNRPPEAASAIPERSEVFGIPGNTGLSAAAREERIAMFYRPFQQTLASVLDAKSARSRNPVIITIHSFTPVFRGETRRLGIGVLHDADARLADAVLAALEGADGIEIARNQPYGPADGVTHTLVEHALSRGLLNVMIEIRSDLISSRNEQKAMARLIYGAVTSLVGTQQAAVAGRG